MTTYIRRSPFPALASAAARLQTEPFRSQSAVPSLLLLTDSDRLPEPEAAIARLPGGIRSRLGQRFKAAVIVRERDPASLEKLVRRLRPLCRQRGIALIIANDIRLALRVDADGVHFAERNLSARLARFLSTRRRRRLLVTASAHNARAVLKACKLDVDAILVAPVFATKSHPGSVSLGAIRFAGIISKSKARLRGRTIIALGGVAPQNANRLIAAGANGFAAIESLA